MTTNDGDPPSPTTLGTKFEYSIDLPYDFDATSPDTQNMVNLDFHCF